MDLRFLSVLGPDSDREEIAMSPSTLFKPREGSMTKAQLVARAHCVAEALHQEKFLVGTEAIGLRPAHGLLVQKKERFHRGKRQSKKGSPTRSFWGAKRCLNFK